MLTLALVFNKLLAETFLRVACPLEGIYRNFEVPLTMRADVSVRVVAARKLERRSTIKAAGHATESYP
jgi:hypothetical protein